LSPKTHHYFSEAFDGLSMPLKPARENLLARLRLLIKRPHLSAVSFLKSVAASDINFMPRYVLMRSAASSAAQKRDYEDACEGCQIGGSPALEDSANP
jgi:hypothetical protein